MKKIEKLKETVKSNKKLRVAYEWFKAKNFEGNFEGIIKKYCGKKAYALLLSIKENWRPYLSGLLIALYFYGMLVNSFNTAMNNFKFNLSGKILTLNPFRNIPAAFSSAGFGIIFFIGIMYALYSKKWSHLLTGVKVTKDKRGFYMVDEGTHGTSGWMCEKETQKVFNIGAADEIESPILGKLEENGDYLGVKGNIGLNRHIMVYGASGAGKSRGFVKPFILKTAKIKESMVIVDPKGEFFESVSGYLQDKGYTVKAFNLLDMENSDGWNCIGETSGDADMVQSVAEVIIRNTSNANERQDFWDKAEMNLLMALMLYVQSLKIPGTNELLPISERSLGAIYNLLSSEGITSLEQKFNQLLPGHPALVPYGIFKQAAHQLWGNIAIGLGSRLNVFQNPLVDKITKHHDIDLELPGKQPCAYFCIISDQDSSLEFLSSLFFSLLFKKLSDYARTSGINGRLPVPVNVILDEFCNVGKILDFKKTVSTVRSRGINCQIIIQSAAQLAGKYPVKEWEELISNCDTQLFLGCNDIFTAKYISENCGNLTIQLTNSMSPQTPLFSPFTSSARPYSQTRSNNTRPLMYPDEILRLDNSECLIFLRGQKPLKAYKIIPDELSEFSELRDVKIADYIPKWRNAENEKLSNGAGKETAAVIAPKEPQEPEKTEQDREEQGAAEEDTRLFSNEPPNTPHKPLMPYKPKHIRNIMENLRGGTR
jgi:type IV secretion system protein VirD4